MRPSPPYVPNICSPPYAEILMWNSRIARSANSKTIGTASRPAYATLTSTVPFPPFAFSAALSDPIAMPRQRSKERIFRQTMRGVEPAEPGRSWPLRLIRSIGTDSKSKRPLAPAKPSSSVLLISPQNRILLLQRVNNATSFASAHVFPGGHVDLEDGELPPTSDPKCHEDSIPYRVAAIRECFEESGILLAHSRTNPNSLAHITKDERNAGRKRIHSKELDFEKWLKERDAIADLDGLIPFTRWLTPPKIPKRYSTQMYLYFLPLESTELDPTSTQAKEMYIPTHDGGIEHTTAQFLYPQEWVDSSVRNEIVLFPPQFAMLALIAPFLKPMPPDATESTRSLLLEQRENLRVWIQSDGNPPWGEKCISPEAVKFVKREYILLGLAKPGPELEGTSRKGDDERLIKVVSEVEYDKGRQRPRPMELVMRKDVDMKTGRFIAKI